MLRARLVVVGADFHFGYRRHGDVPLLQRMGAELGFEVIGLGLVARVRRPARGIPVLVDAHPRAACAAGDVEGAAAALGRPHEVRGRVEHGDRRGRDSRLPDGQRRVPERICLPADGVYAGTFADEDGVEHPPRSRSGAARPSTRSRRSSCSRRTSSTSTATSTARPPASASRRRLRGQERFDSVDDLIAQMGRDVRRPGDDAGAVAASNRATERGSRATRAWSGSVAG